MWALHLNVRFQYKADIRFDCSERLLSSESGHSIIFIDMDISANYFKRCAIASAISHIRSRSGIDCVASGSKVAVLYCFSLSKRSSANSELDLELI